MGRINILYGPKSDNAVFSWGSWRAALPLTNLADRRLHKVARSLNAVIENTRFRIALQKEETLSTIVVGPMNVTSAYKYRIRTYTGSGFGAVVYDSDWVVPFAGVAGDPLDLEWEDPRVWLGNTPFDDPDRGVFIIHPFPTMVTAQYWTVEIDDRNNPAGYIDIGRLFMPTWWNPSVNYANDSNNLTFLDNTLSSEKLSGGMDFWRRLNPRVFKFSLPYIEEGEGFDEAYRLMQVAGYDGEVFVIPDPEETSEISLQQRSFLGTIRAMDGLSQRAVGLIGTGFEIREITS